MISEELSKRYHSALAFLILQSPAYAMFQDFLSNVKLESMKEGVMATDGEKIYIGPEFPNFTPEQQAFVIAHELNHILLRHPWRSTGKDNYLYNVAGDYVINNALHYIDLPNLPFLGKPLPLKEFINPPPDKRNQVITLIDKSLLDMDTDSIYRILLKEVKSGKGKGKPVSSELDSGKGGQPINSDFDGKDVIPNPHDETEDEVLGKLRESVRKYQENHSSEINNNISVERIMKALNMTTALPWNTILQRYLKSLVAGDYTWIPPKPLYYPEDVLPRNIHNTYLPRLKSRSIRVAIAIDVSGSIGEVEIGVFMSNIFALFNAILQQVGYSGVFMLTTADVVWAVKIPPLPTVNEIAQHTPEGGGTDFRPAFELVNRMNPPPDVFIFFTDGDGDYPEKAPPYDVLWLLTPDSTKTPPFGQVLKFTL